MISLQPPAANDAYTRIGSRLPLRVSLVLLLSGLMLFGLAASGIAVTTSMRDRLISRTDDSLRDAANTWARPRQSPITPPEGKSPRRPPTQFYVVTTLTNGVQLDFNDSFAVRPQLDGIGNLDRQTAVTVGSEGNSSTQWRVVQARSDDGTAYVAIRLDDVSDTVDQLIVLQLILGAVVVLIIAVVGYLLIRASLRPLEQVERTAEAIAEGDLNQRVPVGSPTTEVGRLSRSLNVMLHQIQDSFSRVAGSEEQARASEEKMRQFVADASHELRTPLTSISGYSQLYRMAAARAAADTSTTAGMDTGVLMGHIESEADRMKLLVEDLLMLARLDAQRPLESQTVDVIAVAAETVQAAQAREPERSISLEVVGGPGVPEVAGDPARLNQVMTNLITNALVHTPADASITVRVGTDRADAVLKVIDTGPGLEPADANRVFERFYRADASRHRGGGGGSGLGLSIVAKIVEAHHGTVSVETRPGHGASFVVRIPRAGSG